MELDGLSSGVDSRRMRRSGKNKLVRIELCRGSSAWRPDGLIAGDSDAQTVIRYGQVRAAKRQDQVTPSRGPTAHQAGPGPASSRTSSKEPAMESTKTSSRRSMDGHDALHRRPLVLRIIYKRRLARPS